jgi:hypothetical protein
MQHSSFSSRLLRHATALLAITTLSGLFGTAAHAVPSYARQTGAECAACHVGGYGPQLTPYGVRFKLGGYTDTDGKDGKVPLSAMALFNWTRTVKDNPAPDPALHASANNNGGLQEASVFLAGRLSDQIGTFVQGTYSGNERKTALDQMDIRWAKPLTLGDKEGIVGVSLNGNPTLTDPFNTIGQWRFPYTESDFGFGSGPGPLVEGLAGSVMGLNAYTLWDKNFYAELGAYDTLSTKTLNMLNTADAGKFKGLGSYWRVAYFKDMKRDNFSVGLFGFNASLQPDRTVLGTADNYRDIGLDAGYQFLGNREHIYTVNASYIREWQKLNYTLNNAGSDNLHNSLDQFKIAASYHYHQTWGITGSLFDTRTSQDATLNGSSYNGRGNTSGYIMQADWTPWGKESSWGAPWANARLGVQYTGYNKFNGGSHYLDDNGNDRKARDNNTLSLFLWTSI